MVLSDSVCKALQKISGKSNFTFKKEDLLCYAYDASGSLYMPDGVIFPGSEQEISQILALASEHRFIVIPRGAGSGMTGGTAPVKGGLVLVTSRMNKIVEIDDNNFIARVQPGVIVSDLHDAVEKKNLFYPPDPASSSICTIGGNIGECSGGPRAVKYGVTRDYVLGLRAVLPSGGLISTGVRTAKGVAGYDLTRLIVGSEGTLAVVTEITLKLLPKPEGIKTMAVFFSSMKRAADTVSAVIRSAVIPRTVEYLDHQCIELVRDDIEFKMPDGTKAMLIIEVDGSLQSLDSDFSRIREICISHDALDVISAEDAQQTRQLWEARKALSPKLYKIANSKINEDIVVPVDKIPDMVEMTLDLQKSSGLKVVSFGHAGDGNIHCNIMYDKKDRSQAERAQKAVDRLFEETLRLGGTITGEHGVGITKLAYLEKETGKIPIDIMKGIKNVFDPLNILNPGKIF